MKAAKPTPGHLIGVELADEDAAAAAAGQVGRAIGVTGGGDQRVPGGQGGLGDTST